MGSYFGEDYTAFALVRLANLTEEQSRAGPLWRRRSATSPPSSRRRSAQHAATCCKGVDLTRQEVTIPDALAGAIATLRGDWPTSLPHDDLATGWTPAYSLERDRSAADRRFSDLFGAHDGRAAARHELVLDPELALRAGGRQHPDHQHLHLDLDQLLLHLLCVRRRAVHLSSTVSTAETRGRWIRCWAPSGR